MLWVAALRRCLPALPCLQAWVESAAADAPASTEALLHEFLLVVNMGEAGGWVGEGGVMPLPWLL
jgi:hypothetical protein